MRNAGDIFKLLLNIARENEQIRAVLLNGSRADTTIQQDRFSDYDIVYIVKELSSFTGNHNWIDVFGERIILQMPDQMLIPSVRDKTEKYSFGYLMLFKDGVRIDLTLFPADKVKDHFDPGSLTVVLLDKDNQFSSLPAASNNDFIVKKPSLNEFNDCCNEFWWVSTYIAKGLWRNEITYAKYMMETPVRNMFMQMLEWHAGVRTGFSVFVGKHGKYLEKYLEPGLWKQVLKTYPDAETENIWNALLLMTDIFSQLALVVANHSAFEYNTVEAMEVKKYLLAIKEQQ
ncbi:MAG: aminoglycoside 6-adenylyltransferase [Bacteroidetes bacterium]|nr:aminoglycoside 6-adenylyltransferase [Bacteroidota bacterium]